MENAAVNMVYADLLESPLSILSLDFYKLLEKEGYILNSSYHLGFSLFDVFK